jgi:hypothetical protein
MARTTLVGNFLVGNFPWCFGNTHLHGGRVRGEV